MIDPKLDKIEVDENDEIANAAERVGATGTADRSKRRGLSINDTVASNASLSVGGRGVDTSGVRAGAGAGAGMTMTTAGEAGESPAPQFIAGDRGYGTTVLGANDSDVVGSTVPEGYDTEGDLAEAREQLEARAYQCWCDRGNPIGSPEVDWRRAVDEYRASKRRGSTHSATA